MSTDTITLEMEKRTTTGGQVKALRREGTVPTVIHNHGKDSIVAQAPFLALSKVYAQAGKHAPVELTVGKDKYLGIIKEVDLDPRKNTLRHVVFNAIRRDEKVKAEIPLELTGEEVPAEKAGYLVIPHLDVVEVEALPHKLPDVLKVSKEGLTEIGDKITVADIEVPEGVEIFVEPEHAIATVEETKAQISEEDEAAEGEEGAEAEESAEGSEESAESSESSDESKE